MCVCFFFCLKLDALITEGLIHEGGGGGEVGVLVLQPFMVACSSRRYKENRARKKPAFYALRFQYLNPQRVISNIALPSSLRQ